MISYTKYLEKKFVKVCVKTTPSDHFENFLPGKIFFSAQKKIKPGEEIKIPRHCFLARDLDIILQMLFFYKSCADYMAKILNPTSTTRDNYYVIFDVEEIIHNKLV